MSATHPAKPQLYLRRLACQTTPAGPVLEAVSAGPEAGGCRLFFTRASDAKDVGRYLEGLPAPIPSPQVITLNGAPFVISDALPAGLTASPAEPGLLAGRNVLLGVRNGQSADVVLQWLRHHHDQFGVRGAVLFNRTREGQDIDFITELRSQLAASGRDLRVVLIESALPLGHDTLPSEHHPYCVAEAPGKDRMEIPSPDAWTAPLAEGTIYEIARSRFLTEARAVANLDIGDLLHVPAKAPAQNPFDLAADAPGQAVHLSGQHCYPWRLRDDGPAGFGDHICVQFDKPRYRSRWCVAPTGLAPNNFWRFRRISGVGFNAEVAFYSYMAIRHLASNPGLIVPKTSLIESEALLASAQRDFGHKPVRPPKVEFTAPSKDATRTAIVTTMKNEGPFILEWLAYHQAIGVQDFLVYTNDCTDGTDDMFDLLQAKGILQHRENPFREMELKPQHAALQAAEDEPLMQNADWCICMDVDEFLNIKVGNGTLPELYEAVGDANMISCTWRLFGNSDRHLFEDSHTIGQFERCAEEFSPKPHQAWGFKTLFRNIGIFKKMGVHRPKGLRPQLWDQINWVNGSGQPLPREEYRNAWRSTTETYGYDLVSLNHYAVRNAESFLVKRDRGRVNHVDRDQGLAYWFRMNNNATTDRSIMARIPMMEAKLAALMADPEIAAQHHKCVAAHRAKIDALRAQPAQAAFFETLTSARQEKLSRMHRAFGANVFLSGPDVVPDHVVWDDHPEEFFFTVEKGETQH